MLIALAILGSVKLASGLCFVAFLLWAGRKQEVKIHAPITASIAHLRMIGWAIDAYAQDHDEHLPPMESTGSLKLAVKAHVPSGYDFRARDGTTYQVNPTASRRRTFELPPDTVLVYDPTSYDGGRVVLFWSHGESIVHARWIPPDEWLRLARAQNLTAGE